MPDHDYEALPAYPLEYITWLDHQEHTGWQQVKDISKELALPLCHSIGWVVKESHQSILLCPHLLYAKNDVLDLDATGTMEILKSAIRSREEWTPDTGRSSGTR